MIQQKKQQGRDFKQVITDFATQDLYDMQRFFNRNLFVAYVLEIVKCIQIFSLILSKELIRQSNFYATSLLNVVYKIIELFIIEPIINFITQDSNTSQIIFILIALSINLLFIISIIAKFIINWLQISQDNWVNHSLTTLFSCIYIVYIYLFAIPFFIVNLEIAFDQDQSVDSSYIAIAIINLILTFIISIANTIIDFDYQINQIDKLARRDQSIYLMLIVIELFLAIMHIAKLTSELPILHMIYAIVKLYLLVRNLPYYNPNVSLLQIQLISMHLSYSFILFLSMFTTINKHADPILLMIIFTPFALKFAHQLRRMRVVGKPLQDYRLNRNFIDIDNYVRCLAQFSQQQLADEMQTTENKKLIYELVVTTHNDICKDDSCYCIDLNKKVNQNDEIIFKEFLNFHIAYLLQYFIKILGSKEEKTQVHFLYLQFIIDVLQMPAKSYSELQIFKSNITKLSIKEKYILSAIQHCCQKQFDLFFKKSIYQNQRLAIKQVADFDQKINELDNHLKLNLISLRDLYVYLSQDYIIFTELIEKNDDILNQRKTIKQEIEYLFDINPSSMKLQQIAELYIKYIDIENKTIRSFRTNSNQIMKAKLNKQDIGIDLFHPNSCVIYISLVNPIGIIQMASNQASEIFQIKLNDIIKQSCSILMPPAIAEQHNSFLSQFNDRGSLKNIAVGEMQVFGIYPKSGFIIPLQKRIQLHVSNDSFGVCSHLLQGNTNLEYMLSECKDSSVIGITEKLFKTCFVQCFKNPNDLNQIILGKLVPLSEIFTVQQKQIQNITTLLFYPLNISQVDIFRNSNDTIINQFELFFPKINFNTIGFLEIKLDFSIQKLQYNNMSLKYIEISHIRRIRKKREKLELFNQLKKEINKNFEMNMPETTIDEVKSMKSQATSKFTLNATKSKNSKLSENALDKFNNEQKHFVIDNKPIEEDNDSLDQEDNIIKKQVTDLNTADKLKSEDDFKKQTNVQLLPQQYSQKQQQQSLIGFEENIIDEAELIANNDSTNRDMPHSILPIQNLHRCQMDVVERYQQYLDQDNFEANISQFLNNRSQSYIASQSRADLGGLSNNQLLHPETNRTENQVQQAFPKTNTGDDFSNKQQSNEQQSVTLMNQNHTEDKKQQKVKEFLPEKSLTESHQSEFSQFDAGSKNINSDSLNANDGAFGDLLNDKFMGGEQQSVRSSANTDVQKRFQILEAIRSVQQPDIIKQINLAGWFAFVILIISSTVVYLLLVQNFDFVRLTFQNMVIAPEIKEKYCSVIYNKEFERITKQKLNLWAIQDQSVDSALAQGSKYLKMQQTKQINLIKQQSKDITGQFYNHNKEIITLKMYTELGDQFDQQFSINYAFTVFAHFTTRYIQPNDRLPVRYFIQKNFNTIVSIVTDLMDFSKRNSFNTLDDIKSAVVITLIIIELVAFFIILTLFPIYYIIQTNREKILRLFCTFAQDKLNIYITQIENIISNETQSKKSVIMKVKQNSKKKTISNHSTLKKFNLIILIIAIFCFLVISLYPVINISIIFTFVGQFENNINEILIYYNAKAHTVCTYAKNYLQIRYYTINETISGEDYLEFQQISKEHKQYLQTLYDVQKNFDQTRFGKGDKQYFNYTTQILKGDICHILFQDNLNLITALPDEAEIQYFKQMCPLLSSGILKQGLLVSLQQIYQKFDEFLPIFLKKNVTTFVKDIQQFDYDYSIYQQHQIYRVLNQVFEINKIMLINMSYESLDFIKSIQNILYIISLVLLLIIFSFGWTQFLNYMNESLNSTKIMLGILHIDYMMENTYILHFINKELIKSTIK